MKNNIFLFENKKALKNKGNIILAVSIFLLQFFVICSVLLMDKNGIDIFLLNEFENIDNNIISLFINKFFPFYNFLFIMTIVFSFGINIVCSEKEEGTLETLMYLPVNRKSVFIQKFNSLFFISYIFFILSICFDFFIILAFGYVKIIDVKFWILYIFVFMPIWILFISTAVWMISLKVFNTKKAYQYSLGFAFVLLMLLNTINILKINVYEINFYIIISLILLIASLLCILYLKKCNLEKIIFNENK